MNKKYLRCGPINIMAKAGRPTKQTDERVQILLDALERGNFREIACKLARIGKTTFYQWLKDDDDFRTQVEYAESKAIDTLQKEVRERDAWKILKNVGKEHYKERTEVEHSGKDGGPIKLIVEDYRSE